jgi:hypothetical protein
MLETLNLVITKISKVVGLLFLLLLIYKKNKTNEDIEVFDAMILILLLS